jgi:hypothetical protein
VETRHLKIYCEDPSPREHAPVCQWCMFMGPPARVWVPRVREYQIAHVCMRVIPHPACVEKNCDEACDDYHPSWWTQLLQRMRLRPFIERRTR